MVMVVMAVVAQRRHVNEMVRELGIEVKRERACGATEISIGPIHCSTKVGSSSALRIFERDKSHRPDSAILGWLFC
jgi:hypothetical protein